MSRTAQTRPAPSRKAEVPPRKETASRKADEAQPAAETAEKDSPLLDLSDQSVKRLLKAGKQRGYVTYDELNSVLPSEEVSSEQIEDTMSMLSDMGINVVESEEGEEPAAEGADDAAADEDDNRAVTAQSLPAKTETRAEPTERTDDPVRMYLREMGSVELLVARGRDRHRQAHRGRPRGHDRRPVRKPPDLPGHHHLARRAQRRQDPAARHHRSGSDLRGPRGQDRAGRRAERSAARHPGRARRSASSRTATAS